MHDYNRGRWKSATLNAGTSKRSSKRRFFTWSLFLLPIYFVIVFASACFVMLGKVVINFFFWFYRLRRLVWWFVAEIQALKTEEIFRYNLSRRTKNCTPNVFLVIIVLFLLLFGAFWLLFWYQKGLKTISF